MLQIVLLEDNLHYRRGLEQIIHDMSGVTLIGSYSNAEAVLKKIDQLKPDIFIVDINLEGMSGIEFIRRAKPFVPHAEFLMCTINDDNTNIFESLKSGATGYMLKESSADEIRNAITEIAAGGSPMSAYISRRVIASFNADPINCLPLLPKASPNARLKYLTTWPAASSTKKSPIASISLPEPLKNTSAIPTSNCRYKIK
ncbi:DNA-binding NarL/FixJ family response regulator [Mucilaginibacter sp. OAE612]